MLLGVPTLVLIAFLLAVGAGVVSVIRWAVTTPRASPRG